MDIRLCVPEMKYGSLAFMKVKYFKEGMEEKRHLKYNTFPQDESFSVSVHDTAGFDAALTNIFSKVNFKFL